MTQTGEQTSSVRPFGKALDASRRRVSGWSRSLIRLGVVDDLTAWLRLEPGDLLAVSPLAIRDSGQPADRNVHRQRRLPPQAG